MSTQSAFPILKDRLMTVIDVYKKEEYFMTTSFEKDTQGKVTKKIGNIRNSGMKSAANVGMSTPEERFETFRKLAKENNAEAQYRLSQCYLNGEGTEEDQIAYLYWLKEAAESGHADAQYEVSQLYYKGISINENEEKGMYWLRKAGENGSARAQFVLGGMHVNDDGEVQDADAFFYWMNKAAKSGFADAQYCLSLCYELVLAWRKMSSSIENGSAGLQRVAVLMHNRN